MRAAIGRRGAIVCDEVPDPVPGPGQVLVRTCACGICGSDLHALQFPQTLARVFQQAGFARPMRADADVVFGHEFCAEILDFGPNTARRFKPGTIVTSVPSVMDADGVQSIGYSDRLPGGYAERMVLSEALLLEVPNGLPPEHAALTEPFAVGEHAVAAARLADAAAAVVVGCGPVGLAVIAALKARGFGPVIAADYAPGRRAFAERLGADEVVDPAVASPHTRWADYGVPQTRVARTLALAAGKRPGRAVVFECVGVPGVLQGLIDAVPSGTEIIVVGVCMQTDRLEPASAIAKELDFRFVLGYSGAEFARTLGNLAEGRIDAGSILTGRVGLDGVAAAFAALATPGDQAKIVVEPWRAG